MKKNIVPWEKDGFIIRQSRKEDAEEYYKNNFNPLNPEIVRFTGCKPSFGHDEVIDFFSHCVDSEERYDFMIVSPEGKIIGESVINDIEPDLRSANFRIALFHPDCCGRGIGSWAVGVTVRFAFEELKLHRLELDVFSFNTRAVKVYEKAGFRREGVRRDAVLDGDEYADDILMSILEDEWRERKE